MSISERLKNIFVGNKELLRPNEIPSIAVYGETLPETWETAVVAVNEFGSRIPTEYDQEVDPESRDATVMLTILNPLKEPRIHKALPCGYDDLEVYTQEVVEGVHDNWVNEHGWSYSYHDRITNWPGIGSWEKIGGNLGRHFDLPFLNQIDELVNKLAEAPHSRRAQAIMWVPFIDAEHHEPPCLQRIWCRVIKSENEKYLLQMNTHWRSRDAFKAAFMNIYAITTLQETIANRISEISGKDIGVGRYVDISDSFHIYGSYIRKGEIDRFMQNIINKPFESRTVRSDNPLVQKEFARGKEKLTKEKNAGN
ncbi:MAG: thymidylate synthase [bacterium]